MTEIDFGNFSVRGYLALIRKDSSTHMVPTSPGKSRNFAEILEKSGNFFVVKQSKGEISK